MDVTFFGEGCHKGIPFSHMGFYDYYQGMRITNIVWTGDTEE